MSRTRGRVNMARGMRSGGLLFVGAVCLLLAPLSAQAQIDFSKLWEDLSPAVVAVQTPTLGTGSGFVVQYESSDNQTAWGILTACHVASGAPRSFADADRRPQVQVVFRAWERDVQMPAAVMGCDAQRDVALLQPVNADDEVTTLPAYFKGLAEERNAPELRRFPRLWLDDNGTDLAPLSSVFAIGYPGPFSELNAVMGRISAQLPVPYVRASDGTLYAGEAMFVYEGGADATLDSDAIRQIRQLAGLELASLAKLAQRTLDSGLGMMLYTTAFPGSSRATGWDVVGVEDGVVQVQERPVEVGSSLFGGTTITIAPREDREGAVSFQQRFVRLDASVGSGFSGAPVLNLSGQVVGMVQWGLQNTPGGHFALPGSDLTEALRDLSSSVTSFD